MGKFVDLTGKVFCDRTFLKYLGNSRWLVRCNKCGYETSCLGTQSQKHGCRKCYGAKINEKYFESIDSEDKAYFFGFIWADGYVNSRFKTCKIDVQESDIDVLQKFKEKTEYTGNINSYLAKMSQSYRSKDSIMYRVHIINKQFAETLEGHGLVAHREKSSFPECIDNESFVRDFIRGYFDGNGSVSTSGGMTLNFCGGTKILSDIEQIMTAFDFKFSHHRRKPDNEDNDMIILMGGRSEIKRFLDYLYDGSSIYLERKYKKYLFVKQNY